MARRRFPHADKLVYQAVNGILSSKVGAKVRVYTDEACTVLADITTLGGVAIANSELTVDANSQFTDFLGPDGAPWGTDTLFGKGVGAASGIAMFARYDDRMDTLESNFTICTAATRPVTGLFNGKRIYETDTFRHYTYNGSAWVYQHGGSVPRTALPLLSGWELVPTAPLPPEYWKDGEGIVHVVGSIRNQLAYTPGAGQNLAQLPVGFRPSGLATYSTPVHMDTVRSIDIRTDGFLLSERGAAVLALSTFSFNIHFPAA